MVNRAVAAFVAASLLVSVGVGGPARADNQMGYTLMSQQEALGLPRNGGALGLDVDRGRIISDSDMTFDVMRVKSVRRGSPAERAGFTVGDQIIAVDGHVFPTIASFAGYVGSTRPGQVIAIDYMPRGAGPAQAQRVAVAVASAAPGQALGQDGRGGPPEPARREERTGMSTGEKVAIGVGAAALLGCYELGCFSRGSSNPSDAERQQMIARQRQVQMQEQARYGQQGQYPQQQPQFQQQYQQQQQQYPSR